MKIKVKKCKICEKKLNVYKQIFYNGIAKNGINRRENTFSKDGIMFGLSWFCNDCWEILINQKVYKLIIHKNRITEVVN